MKNYSNEYKQPQYWSTISENIATEFLNTFKFQHLQAKIFRGIKWGVLCHILVDTLARSQIDVICRLKKDSHCCVIIMTYTLHLFYSSN